MWIDLHQPHANRRRQHLAAGNTDTGDPMGITNGKEYNDKDGKNVNTSVCIIGSGPAGITAAWHLLTQGITDITLIEGSRDFRATRDPMTASWPDKVLLYCGVADGLFATNEPKFLIKPYKGDPGATWERERVYGGTSNHWSGQCRPLDPITFEGREGFPAWPIRRKDLNPYYAKASALCRLHGEYGCDGDNFTTDYWAKILGGQDPKLDGFCAEMYQFVGRDYKKFATRGFGVDGKPIGEHPINVILNATLLDIDHNGHTVSRLHVASMDDQQCPQVCTEFFIHADVYVLACGAVANARQLLLSNVGNDCVGRYFMCHPIADNVFTISEDFLDDREKKLMTPQWTAPITRSGVQGRFSPDAEQQNNFGGCWFDPNTYNPPNYGYYLEMAPNKNSRVTLDDEGPCDRVFKQKRTKITWELSDTEKSDTDKKTYNHTTELYKKAVEEHARKLNRKVEVSFEEWENLKNQWVVNGHHIGTTRMSAEADDGVVDKNLKVHSLDNLYVAGSSVFRTAGISNPTFTIVALSIRLAEHLSQVLKGSTTP